MIQLNELRIGNWIYDPDREFLGGKDAGFVQVNSFSSEYAGMVHHRKVTSSGEAHSGNDANRLEPILLAPEILVMCGFVNDRGAWWTLKIPLPEGYTYPEGYFSFSYCAGGVLGINLYPGGGFSLEDAVQLMKKEKERGVNIKESSFQLNIVNQIFPPVSIKYLHQLQNLYFALTGTELEINIIIKAK